MAHFGCPSCGETVQAGWVKCPHCGASIVGLTSTPEPKRLGRFSIVVILLAVLVALAWIAKLANVPGQ